MEILKNSIGAVTDEIGFMLLPALTNLARDTGPKIVGVIEKLSGFFLDFAERALPTVTQAIDGVVEQISMMADAFIAMNEALATIDFSVLNTQISELKITLNADMWAQVFGFIAQQVALTIVNIQQLIAEVNRLGTEFVLLGEFIKGDTSWSEYRQKMIDLRVAFHEQQGAFQATYDAINSKDWAGVIAAISGVNKLNEEATDWWQRHGTAATEATTQIVNQAGPALMDLATIWDQSYAAIEAITASAMDNSRMKVLDTFGKLAQDYASHATAIVNLEQEKARQLAFLEYQYQQAVAAAQAAGETAKLQTLAASHNAQYKAVVAYFNTRISTEKAGQNTVFTIAKQYFLVTLRTMAMQLRAQVSMVVANMRALVSATVGGYASMSAAVLAYNKI